MSRTQSIFHASSTRSRKSKASSASSVSTVDGVERDEAHLSEPNTLGRILGIDFGSRRIGIALSDPLQIIAQSLETIANVRNAVEQIKRIADREKVEVIVVGMPLNLKGERGQKAKEVEAFISHLEEATQIRVVHWDERFTTSVARGTMLMMGTKRKERREHKGRIDAMAAAIMLQGYLDNRKRSLRC